MYKTSFDEVIVNVWQLFKLCEQRLTAYHTKPFVSVFSVLIKNNCRQNPPKYGIGFAYMWNTYICLSLEKLRLQTNVENDANAFRFFSILLLAVIHDICITVLYCIAVPLSHHICVNPFQINFWITNQTIIIQCNQDAN